MDKEKENALRMLNGCICRLSVTDEEDEAYRVFSGITMWAQQILNHTLRRIYDQNHPEEGGEAHVRRTKRKKTLKSRKMTVTL